MSQIVKDLVMQFSPESCYYLSLRSKYSPQHTVFKYPQSMFSPYSDRPDFTPTQNKGFFKRQRWWWWWWWW